MTIGIGILTVEERVPRAAALAQELVSLHGYAPMGPIVNVDRERRGPWWNFQFTGEMLLHEGHTHLCLLEDDVKLCRDFLQVLTDVVKAVPTDPLSLFTARHSIVKEADKKGTCLLRRFGLDTAQGLVFPGFQFQGLTVWADANEHAHPDWQFHGDMRISAWSKARRWPIVHVIPNLVDHDVSIPSTLGHTGRTRYGDRVSPRFYDQVVTAGWSWGQPK
jgi:hypothetical protein